MKDCPKCRNRPITFSSWARGANAFRYRCDSCHAKLKCNGATIFGFILTLVIGVATLIVAQTVFDIDVGRGKLARYLLILIPVLFGGTFTWLLAGYRVDERSPANLTLGGDS